MAVFQFGDLVRDARNNIVEDSVGTTAKLRIFTGSLPTNCAAADTGTLIADLTLPSDWMAASAAGIKAKTGTWSGVGHANAGAGMDAGYFRIKNNAGTVTHIQGDITVTAGGGAMTIDVLSIAATVPVTVTAFTLTDGNP